MSQPRIRLEQPAPQPFADADADRLLMVRLHGRPFWCSCGANVFRRLPEGLYRCTGCGAVYVGRKASTGRADG